MISIMLYKSVNTVLAQKKYSINVNDNIINNNNKLLLKDQKQKALKIGCSFLLSGENKKLVNMNGNTHNS